MPTFHYRAMASDGKTLNNWVYGVSADACVEDLHKQGLTILFLREEKSSRAVGNRKERGPSWKTLGKRVKDQDLISFTEQFGAMIEAGVPITVCLDNLTRETHNKALQEIIRETQKKVQGGESLWAAFGAHPEVFGQLFVQMVRAGEASGQLGAILQQLSVYLEATHALKQKLYTVLAYPVFLLGLSVTAMFFLVVKILPIFSGIYQKFGAKLPPLTLMLLHLSDTVRAHLGGFFLGAGVIGAVVLYCARSERGRDVIDRVRLDLPIVGDLMRKTIYSRFARAMGVLLRSGVPILEALKIVSRVSENRLIERELIECTRKISEGSTVSEALKASRQFPDMLVNMIATGEEVGRLDELMVKVATYYERRTEAVIKTFSSLVEPALIVFIGGIVGVILFAMFIPIFQMGKTFR
ncbi:MAG TPA: type II secretion system F family protein [bacterium]|nr:type II secretion system F family protein [bacterium]